MRLFAIISLVLCSQLCLAQKTRDKDKVIIRIAFEKQGDSLDTREIREVADDSSLLFPYYVSLGSNDLKFIHYEFFRIDTGRYFVREYFKNSFSEVGNVKSYGEQVISKKTGDTIPVDVFNANGEMIRTERVAERFSVKEGIWKEFENDTWPSVFWKGTYINNKKTGIWKRMLQTYEDTLVLEETDYGRNPIKITYDDNGFRSKSIFDLKTLLNGSWSDGSCDGNDIVEFVKDRPGLIHKVGPMYLDISYYVFDKSGRFVKHFAKDCKEVNKLLNQGKWQLRRSGNQTFIDLIFKNGVIWEMKLLYYGEKQGLIMILNKHPSAPKMK